MTRFHWHAASALTLYPPGLAACKKALEDALITSSSDIASSVAPADGMPTMVTSADSALADSSADINALTPQLTPDQPPPLDAIKTASGKNVEQAYLGAQR